jgi:hypothetical protein
VPIHTSAEPKMYDSTKSLFLLKHTPFNRLTAYYS